MAKSSMIKPRNSEILLILGFFMSYIWRFYCDLLLKISEKIKLTTPGAVVMSSIDDMLGFHHL